MARFGEKVNKTGVFALLMVLSVLSLLLPAAWTDWLKGVTQLLVPGQSLLYRMGVRTVQAARDLDRATNSTALDAAEADIRTLHNQLVFQDGLLQQLRTENSGLRGLRERYVPRDVRLIPARVVARDVVSHRDSVLLARGAARGASYQDWVTSRVFVDRGADEGAERGFSVLAREYLIGRIEQVQPYMARVVLLSDVTSRTLVRIGRLESGRFVAVDYPCALSGQGGGRMSILDVPEQYVEQAAAGAARPPAGTPRIGIGDLVASGPEEHGLAAPMILGRVSALTRDPRKRLVVTVEVEPAIRPEALGDVFIVASKPDNDLLGGGLP